MGKTKAQLGKAASHVRIYHRQMQSPAWRALSPSAVKVLLSLAALERGDNNGEIYFSDRKGAEVNGLSRNTVRKSLGELIEKGFVYCSEQGGFSRKTPHAACYGLTWAAGPMGSEWRAPSHAYEQWRPESGNTRDQLLTATGSIPEQEAETRLATGADFGPAEVEKRLVSVDRPMSEIEPQTIYQGGEANPGQRGNRKHAGNQASDPRADFLAALRNQLTDHLKKSAAGEQSRIATAIGCNGGTLSKFIGGRNLPDSYVDRLAKALLRSAEHPAAPTDSTNAATARRRPILSLARATGARP